MALQVGGYQGATRCTSGPQPGAWGYMDWFLSAYKSRGGVNSGIYNCRSVRGGSTTSLHGEGRACDFGIRPYSASYGTQLANALVNMSKELGIQCVIWNRKIWSSSYARSGWRNYSGVNPHVDHLHVELMWWSANQSRAAARDRINKVIGSGQSVPAPDPTPEPKPKTFMEEIMANREHGRRTGASNYQKIGKGAKARVRAANPAKGKGDGKGVHKLAKAIKGRDYLGSVTVGVQYVPQGQNVRARIVGVEYPGGGKPAKVTELTRMPVETFPANSSGWAYVNLCLDDRAQFNGEYQVMVENHSSAQVVVAEVRSSVHYS